MTMMPLALLSLIGSSIIACTTTPSFMDAKTMARTCSIDRRDEDDDLNNGGMDRGRGVMLPRLLLLIPPMEQLLAKTDNNNCVGDGG
jgi:hypothetical protein